MALNRIVEEQRYRKTRVSTVGSTPVVASDVNPIIDAVNAINTSSSAWTDYSTSTTLVGWNSPTTKILRYLTIGKIMFVQFSFAGTSNSTAVSFTLPITADGTQAMEYAVVRDNSSFQDHSGYASILDGAATINLYPDAVNTTWTGSGDKRTIGSFFLVID